MKDRIISMKEVEPYIYEILFVTVHNGACQCSGYKDCNCSSLNGTTTNTYIRYSNGTLNNGGNLRLYKDISGCKSSLSSLFNLNQKQPNQ